MHRCIREPIADERRKAGILNDSSVEQDTSSPPFVIKGENDEDDNDDDCHGEDVTNVNPVRTQRTVVEKSREILDELMGSDDEVSRSSEEESDDIGEEDTDDMVSHEVARRDKSLQFLFDAFDEGEDDKDVERFVMGNIQWYNEVSE